jgi:endoglucanase
MSKGTMMIGALSGGPDASREDAVTQALPQNLPVAKIYADDNRSYSTNEIAIYYNSALLYLLTAVY